jgi:FKBP-type peptidyl-prolyl cis-trans isomerase FkpA
MIRWALFSLAFLLLSCETPVQELTGPQPDRIGEQFVRSNRYMQRRHQDHIGAFIERLGWNAETTPSGLWIVIREPGTGPEIGEGDRVIYSYESLLLDGTPCYSASVQDPKVVVIGRGGIETGVEEGLRHLGKGTEATFLIPPHLAHGNFGDRNKIPGNSVLIYRVKILEVEAG